MKRSGIFSVVAALAFAFAFAFGAMPVSALPSHEEFVSVQGAGTGLMIDPSFVLEAESFADIEEASSLPSRPAAVVVRPDAEMNVTLGGETMPLAEVFSGYLKGKFIPVVRLDEGNADAFIEWMTGTCYIADIMAISDDIGTIGKLYADETCYIVNTVYDLTSLEIGEDRYALWEHIGAANAAGCNILLFDAADENIGVAAEYVPAMSKTCWAEASSYEECAAAIAAGCYGVMSSSAEDMARAAALFSEEGFARAQFVSSHRGITAYANENSLTAVAAAANEGATHVEIDLQISSDGQLLLCHESDAGAVSTAPSGTWFATNPSRNLLGYTLDDYSERYGETFAALEEIVELVSGTDMIVMLELKLDNGSSAAVDSLHAIENLAAFAEDHPEMEGRWFAITFFAPYARQMRELMPEIPVGFLGYGAADNGEKWDSQPLQSDVAAKIDFLRRYNMFLDETSGDTPAAYAQAYLARGYARNTWTFSDTSHFSVGANIATTDAAEDVSMLVKEVCPSGTLSVTEAQLREGKATAPCLTYCGWETQKECTIEVISRTGDRAVAVLRCTEEGGTAYGLYSGAVALTVV